MRAYMMFILLAFNQLVSGQDIQGIVHPAEMVSALAQLTTPLKVTLQTPVADRGQVSLPSEIENAFVFKVDQNGLGAMLYTGNEHRLYEVPFEIPDGSQIKLLVYPVVEDADYGTLITTLQGITSEKLNIRHFRGVIQGQEGSLVALSYVDGEFMGFISSPRISGNIAIESIEGEDYHIAYNTGDLSDFQHFHCGTPDSGEGYTREELTFDENSRSSATCVRIYLEVDYDIYLSKGASILAAGNYISGLYNQVATLFAAEQIKLVVSEIFIWNQPSPYTGTTSSAMLNQFGQFRDQFNGDLAQLLSHKASGGIAYLNGFCRSNKDFSMSFASIHTTFQQLPLYSWSVQVCAHELGHLFGAQHTHACVWNGNNTALDGCYTVEGNCPQPALPDQPGTVMSYCHLTTRGISFTQGFGLQPGNVMRSRVNASSCLQACLGGEENGCSKNTVTLQLKTDNYPSETTWTLKNDRNELVYAGGPYRFPLSATSENWCLADGCYTFTMSDKYGDGICCAFGQGSFSVLKNEQVLISGGQFGKSIAMTFCVQAGQQVTCSDGIQNGSETGIDCGGAACPPCQTAEKSNLFGSYFESGWDNWQSGGLYAVRYSGNLSPEGSFSIRLSHRNTISSSMTSPVIQALSFDSLILEYSIYAESYEAGEGFSIWIFDGITWKFHRKLTVGQDFYNNQKKNLKLTLSQGLHNGLRIRFQNDGSDTSDKIYIDAVIASGYGKKNTPTCNDGIQNGDETGIDCGGMACFACPTCNDGVQNGTETGVDCGGNCIACPTCNDGIRNGTETGVDCGGVCVPCVGNSSVTIGGYFFENGMDNWTDAGINCFRYGGINSPEGIYSIRLRNKGDQAQLISPVFNLLPYQKLSVEFAVLPQSLEPGEFLSMDFLHGSQVVSLGKFYAPADLVNGVGKTFVREIPLNGVQTGRIRFQMNGDDNTDFTFIDSIVIKGILPSTVMDMAEENALNINSSEQISIFPNPSSQDFTIYGAKPQMEVSITNISGQELWKGKINDSEYIIPAATWQAGIYILTLHHPDGPETRRLIKY